MSSNARFNPTFSVMKGIAIISVVLGHCPALPFVGKFVNQYHLAVFFFVAGYFFKEKYLETPKIFIVKRLKSLYFPYVIFGLLALYLHNVFYGLHIVGDYMSMPDFILGGRNLVVKLYSEEALMGAMWFCPALLIVSYMSYFIFWLTRKHKNLRHLSFLFVMTVGAVCCYFHIKSPYCVWQYAPICILFYGGFVFKHHEDCFANVKSKIVWSVLLLLLLGILAKYNVCAYLQPFHIANENVFVMVCIGIVGCIAIYLLSSTLVVTKLGKWLAVIGRYSFSIMAIHFLAFKIINFIQCLVYGYDLNKISSFPFLRLDNGWWMAYAIVGVFVPMLCSILYHKSVNIISYVRNRND